MNPSRRYGISNQRKYYKQHTSQESFVTLEITFALANYFNVFSTILHLKPDGGRSLEKCWFQSNAFNWDSLNFCKSFLAFVCLFIFSPLTVQLYNQKLNKSHIHINTRRFCVRWIKAPRSASCVLYFNFCFSPLPTSSCSHS